MLVRGGGVFGPGCGLWVVRRFGSGMGFGLGGRLQSCLEPRGEFFVSQLSAGHGLPHPELRPTSGLATELVAERDQASERMLLRTLEDPVQANLPDKWEGAR